MSQRYRSSAVAQKMLQGSCRCLGVEADEYATSQQCAEIGNNIVEWHVCQYRDALPRLQSVCQQGISQ